MNAIDTLITLADVRGSLDLRCQFQGDWALDHPPEAPGTAPYHIVLAGECHVELPDRRDVKLVAGDILVLPGGAAHALRSPGKRVMPSVPRREPGGLLEVKRFGDGADLDLLCGSFHYQQGSMLFSALPDHVLISTHALGTEHALGALVALLRSEADTDQAGGQYMVNALTSALFTLVLRAHLAQSPQGNGSLALLSDRRLSRAWQAMLANPAHQWTVEGLAELATMSRATFMRTFSKVSGSSPWVLLTQVRMQMAFGLLSRSRSGLSDIAAEVGYQSQAAFAKVFKDTYGLAPGQMRRSLASVKSG
ncbi:AraC family transcriptional regulator [Pseudomonas sp. GD03842]|uniref:AraC family transcriptional regulator n=1 Tax=unclassified Pseudomonas TaxID=196821 RepID=UPI000D3AA8F9|nr:MULTISPECIES: AraC family transcriptional regulator [unclassified Pseudomonas]MDH0745326.1 AraC family transcriptional regulator [Pseudomonas sp. GD03842]RAU43397.1 AraC family transcriptional regulator [Pseudomonas sp. RIT 409]RAU44961.1 AraC family transcriptional regulator [Pseudomonas sp. RIT 412]